MTEKHTPSDAESDLTAYARAMRTGNDARAADIEVRWGLYGYTPQVVSTVLGCVATGLPLDAAIDEATAPSPRCCEHGCAGCDDCTDYCAGSAA